MSSTRKMAIAGESLTGHTYRAVQYDTGDSYEVDKSTASGAAGYQEAFAGTVVTEGADTKPVELCCSGIVKVEFAGTVQPGELIMPTTLGKFIKRTAGYCAVGRALPDLRSSGLAAFSTSRPRGDVELFPCPIGYSKTTASITFGDEIADGAASTKTMTVAGLTTSDVVFVNLAGGLDAGLQVADCWVSAADTISVTVTNCSGGAITNSGGAITARIGIIKG